MRYLQGQGGSFRRVILHFAKCAVRVPVSICRWDGMEGSSCFSGRLDFVKLEKQTGCASIHVSAMPRSRYPRASEMDLKGIKQLCESTCSLTTLARQGANPRGSD
jgi:hypothetical protein